MTSLRQVMSEGAASLDQDTARLDCQLLLCHLLNKPRSWLFAHDDECLSTEQVSSYHALLDQRRNGKPMAYILGYQEFWSLQFRVTPDVLIPRPETELLIETVLAHHDGKPKYIADLGTGSGAIAITLALEHQTDFLIAMDYSSAALKIAHENKQQLNATNVELIHGDWLTCLAPRSCDIIVSNPPYIAENDLHLADLKHEPESALVAGKDGLDDIREIIKGASSVLKPGGLLAMEHGFDQQPAILELLDAAGYQDIFGHQDLAGQPRITTARVP